MVNGCSITGHAAGAVAGARGCLLPFPILALLAGLGNLLGHERLHVLLVLPKAPGPHHAAQGALVCADLTPQ